MAIHTFNQTMGLYKSISNMEIAITVYRSGLSYRLNAGAEVAVVTGLLNLQKINMGSHSNEIPETFPRKSRLDIMDSDKINAFF